MTSVSFYHLTATPLERALPKLLEKILSAGFKVALLAEEARLEPLNQLLWSYDPDSFLPHGTLADGDAARQPVLLIHQLSDWPQENSEAKSLLFITSGAKAEGPFERVVDMFDGRDETALDSARARWKDYKNAGHTLSYYQQTESGSWQQKAAS